MSNKIAKAIECISDKFILNGDLKPVSEFVPINENQNVSIYEVVRVINGKPLFFEDHLQRLENSAQLVNQNCICKNEQLKEQFHTLIESCNMAEGNIKITVFFSPKSLSPDILLYYIPTKYPTENEYRNGVATVTLKAERKIPNAKVLNRDLRAKTNELIKNHNVYEVILIDENGFITEGSRSNVFIIRDDVLYTSPGTEVLKGITRKHVIEAAERLGIKICEKQMHISELNTFDGLFISGTSPNVLPVIRIDDSKFNFESIHLHRIMKEYNRIVEDYITGY